ncbi:MAG: replicative DNA helicase [Planctomycetaceae bacterium]|nr:replicative DNA helicase [Planctomycetaceae bacterium]
MDKHVSPEAEAAILGAMLLYPQCIPEVIEKVQDDYFYATEHKLLFHAIKKIAKNNCTPCAITLRDELKRTDSLDTAGGMQKITHITESVPTSSNINAYCAIVFDKWRERELLTYSRKIRDIVAGPATADDKILQTETELHYITSKCTKQDVICVADYIDSVSFAKQTYLSTGFQSLDSYFYGMGAGDMITIAGRPASGKSCLLNNIAVNIASREIPVAIFSLEMPRDQLQQRMLCSLARVDLKAALQNNLNEKQEQAIEFARQWLKRHPIYIDDTPRLTPTDLRFKTMQLVARYGVQAIFIDYLQLMTSERGSSLNERATDISQAIKQVGLEFRIPVVCAAQLNRMPEGRDGGQPRVSDLRDSGSIEQDSDIVVLIHRKDMYGGANGHTDVIVGKNRRGETGVSQMMFLGKYTLFTEPTYERTDSGNLRPTFKIPSLLDQSS